MFKKAPAPQEMFKKAPAPAPAPKKMLGSNAPAPAPQHWSEGTPLEYWPVCSNSHRLPNVCVFCELYCLQHVFFYAFCKPLCSIVLLPSSAILTNLTLFIFHVLNTTVSLFTVKPFCDLSLPVCPAPFGVLCAWWNTHTMTVLHHGLYNFIVFFLLEKKNSTLPLQSLSINYKVPL